VDLASEGYIASDCHENGEEIPHQKNNWICYDFKEKRVVPSHYSIRSIDAEQGDAHLKSWLVEMSLDGENWKQIDFRENNTELNGKSIMKTFAVTGAQECRFLRLVHIGRSHHGHDRLAISAWEIFSTLVQ
jgi:hypothetical protein